MNKQKANCKICNSEFEYYKSNSEGLFCSRVCYNKWTKTEEGKKQASQKAINQSQMLNQPNTQKLKDEVLIKLWERFKNNDESLSSLFKKFGYKRVPPKKLIKIIGKEEYDKYKTKNKFKNHGYLYKRGCHYERKAINELKKVGYMVIRSTKSSGIFDIWALKSNLRLIQVKATKSHANFSKLKSELEKVNVPSFCTKELWIWNEREGWNKVIIQKQGEIDA